MRPVDLELSTATSHGPDRAVVAARRVVDGACLVELDAGGEGMPGRLTAQVALDHAPAVGDEVSITLNPKRAHVFPCKTGNPAKLG